MTECFGCISLKTLDDVYSPDRRYHGDNNSSYPISREPTTRNSSILRIIHVGGEEETFTEPKYASELLNQYPDHCLTFPDIFRRPWAVVSPERRLLPGEKFCLIRSSIVKKLQLELLQNLSRKPLVDHNNSVIVSEETNLLNDVQKPRTSSREFCTRSEDDCKKDF
ncbi:hypothetical protein SUGI_0014960 [Cryptomeria japonica]|nr:hypothetical protein SUGI_0014960 [Cryptomeria japonica]